MSFVHIQRILIDFSKVSPGASTESSPLTHITPSLSCQPEPAGLQQTCTAAQAAFVREFGAPAGHHDSPTTPLSPIMPSVVALPRQVIGTALNLTGKAAAAAATSGTVKDLVSSFADKVTSTRLAPS